MEEKVTLLVDMDEVLVDFRGGACRVHGWDREEVDQKTMELRCWDMNALTGITVDKFWEGIHKEQDSFWSSLSPLPWFEELVRFLNAEVGQNWYVVSSPSQCPSSYHGKAQWIEKYFGHEFMNYRFLPLGNKSLLAPVGLLIDDRELNCNKFVKAGGDAILFPSVGNKLYPLRNDPVEYLKSQLL